MSKPTIIALAGNPNCGKTTLFNALTGSRQRVGNWPGVTVEHVEGDYRHGDHEAIVVDLPGIYSFSAYSADERIARNYILQQKPDVVVNIVDATNLERNLYLTTQLLEMRVPVVVALNMIDIARHRRIHIEHKHLARHLGCPVIPIVASRGQGLEELKDAIDGVSETHAVSSTRVEYDEEVEEALDRIQHQVAPLASEKRVDPRWLAIKMLEGDALAHELGAGRFDDTLSVEIPRIEKHVGDDIDIVIADGRYGFIHGLSRDVLRQENRLRRTVSDAIDQVVLNRVLGIPLFLLAMYLMFMITINVGGPFIDFFDRLCGALFVDGFRVLLEGLRVPEYGVALLADGVGGGIQTVSTFIPPIFLIFLCLSFLEDSGYMARAAFVMDRLLRTIGLPGKAFIPMLVGFGCNVPAIMATRTLENDRDRILTIVINPFMSCGARLPVYALFAVAFFPEHGSLLIFSLYIVGIILAILTGLLLKRTILRGEPSTFVMELPPYHVPTVRGIMHHTWNRLKGFIVRAGRVILVVVVILNIFSALGAEGADGTHARGSVLGTVSRALTPVFRPMGITDKNWPACVGLFTGVFAKEAVVGALDTLYTRLSHEDARLDARGDVEPFAFWEAVRDAFRAIPEGFAGMSLGMADVEGAVADQAEASRSREVFGAMQRYFGGRPAALAYVLFVLIYAPCVAALAAIYREAGLRWMLFSVCYLTGLAWVMATVCYQTLTFFDHPAQSLTWLTVCAVIAAVFIGGMHLKARLQVRR